MVIYDSSGPAAPEAPAPGFLSRTTFNTGHKVIGLRYLWLALGSVLLGMLLSLLMRVHRAHAPVHDSLTAFEEMHAPYEREKAMRVE